MSAGEQLVMFEPVGAELAQLVSRHAASSVRFQRMADNCETSGRSASCAAYSVLAELSESAANTCELTLQVERLAHLQ